MKPSISNRLLNDMFQIFLGLLENLWVICATTVIKWTHLADMYGPTSDESIKNLYFQTVFLSKAFLK